MTQPFASLPPAQLAGILCNDPRFQKYAVHRSGVTGQSFNTSADAQYLCDVCNVTNRRDLNAGGHALDRFNALRTEFDAWTGKFATPRYMRAVRHITA